MARKQKMKVYHGMPKSITDEHTIFYADLDGVIKPIIGETISSASVNFIQMPTGYGVRSAIGGINYRLRERRSMYSTFSIDFWIDIREFRTITSGYPEILAFRLDNTNALKIYYSGSSDRIYCEIYKSDGYNELTILRKARTDKSIPDFCHIRLTCTGSILTSYCNGKLQQTLDLKSNSTYREFEAIVVHSTRTISDLHISKINRGDWFPNLPQDFIEGKAVVKPRMGQQQIKGDPMYSQITQLTVYAHAAGDWSIYNSTPINGAHPSYSNPELSIVGGTNWAQGSFIRITGLNGEVISGVMDADTAICTVLKEVGPSKLLVDSVAKLSVNDRIRAVKISNNQFYPNEDRIYYTVTDIDTNNSIITVDRPSWTQEAINDGWIKAFEITASSSCPTVKTKNGTDVVGAWSGLGTNVATFTLGNNTTNLQGQDLYVEYALTIPHGNSDFPELPHTIERALGDNGVEMKSANTLTIVDDFFGKVGGSSKECPHVMDRYFNYALTTPSNITDKSSYQNYYNTLAVKNDNTVHTSTNTSTGRGQIAFDINLIEMIERKLGVPIPQADKVSWLKSNITQIRFNHYGYGMSAQGNKLYLTKYNAEQKAWNTHNVSTTSSNVTLLRQVINPNYYEIDEKGHIYFLAYTDTSDGNTAAIVRTDYISIEIDLKLDSNYTLMYCDNKRAREDKCNPVLIQKETKTVKRYLPSKECFVTECKYIKMKKQKINHDILNNAVDNGRSYATTQGTGSYAIYHQSWRYKNIVNLLNLELINPYEYNNEGLYTNPFTSKAHTTFICELSDGYIGNNLRFMPCQSYDVPKYLAFKPYITTIDGQLKLSIASSEITRSTAGSSYASKISKSEFAAFDLPNRPLIK